MVLKACPFVSFFQSCVLNEDHASSIQLEDFHPTWRWSVVADTARAQPLCTWMQAAPAIEKSRGTRGASPF